ncbi:hypothetical protein EDD22DRAFT_848601 [Suillus occidentalis]|nr:hypothetical protein EDD22DRAFT_848601 [Suillus occidentalis]
MLECLMAGLDRWNSRDAPELPASIRLWPEETCGAAEIVSEAQSRRGYIRTPATSEQVTHRCKSQMGLVTSWRKMGLGPKLTDRRQCAAISMAVSITSNAKTRKSSTTTVSNSESNLILGGYRMPYLTRREFRNELAVLPSQTTIAACKLEAR